MSLSGEIIMENGDWDRFEKLMMTAIRPLQDGIDGLKTEVGDLRKGHQKAFKELPCIDNTLKLNTIETQLANGKEQRKDEQAIRKDSKDFVLKAITIVISGMVLIATVVGGLHKVGFFKAIAK